jgi:hypothetical protein
MFQGPPILGHKPKQVEENRKFLKYAFKNAYGIVRNLPRISVVQFRCRLLITLIRILSFFICKIQIRWTDPVYNMDQKILNIEAE